MAYLVIVVGALLWLAGAYEMYVGNAIISVERGWSAFISGSVFVAGGIVTIAIGFAIRAMHKLEPAFSRPLATASSPDEIPGAAPRIGMDDMEGTPAVAARAPAAKVPNTRPEIFQVPTVEPYAPELVAQSQPSTARPLDYNDMAAPDFDDLRLRPSLDAEPSAPPAVTSPAPVAHAPVAHATAVPPTAPPVEAPSVASPVMDDWLERSFADLDHDTSVDAARAAAARAHALLDHDTGKADHGEAHGIVETARYPATGLTAHPQPDTTPAEHEGVQISPVIGRYEADGTSYVMYADGSIEAQSAAGIYRFASMAELKTFIES